MKTLVNTIGLRKKEKKIEVISVLYVNLLFFSFFVVVLVSTEDCII